MNVRQKKHYDHELAQPETLRYIRSNNLNNSHDLLKQGIWLYFFLLIFEGALRKWLLPSLAAPLLIVRDPLACWLLLTCWHRYLLPANKFLIGIVMIGLVGVLTAMIFGHGSLPVALFGARIFLLQFPMIFVIGSIFTRKDVLKMGEVMLALCLPMTILIGLQFFSPQYAWINRGIGGTVEETGFQGALGHFRPPGTFSYVTGTYLFYGLACCFLFYYWLSAHRINKLLFISAVMGIIIAVPLSISRTLFFEVCITLAFSMIAALLQPRYLSKILVAVVFVLIILLILSRTGFFQHASETLFVRFSDASLSEGGLKGTLGDRFLGGLITAITGSSQLPFFGYGLGMGTNVGSQLMQGERKFQLHEEEWARQIDELGPFLGLMVTFLRVGFALKIARGSLMKLRKGDILPWMLLSFGLLQIAQGNWSQPTSLGFCILIGGMMLASLKTTQADRNLKDTLG